MMPSFQDIQETMGFPEYFAQAERYAAREASSISRASTSGASASSDSESPGSGQAAVAASRAAGTPSEQHASAAGAGAQPSSVASEPVQEARRQDSSESSGLQGAAEGPQKGIEGRANAAEGTAQGQLASLDDELRDLETGGNGSSRESSGAGESTPVVEPDAIVVSGTRKGETGAHTLRDSLMQCLPAPLRILIEAGRSTIRSVGDVEVKSHHWYGMASRRCEGMTPLCRT